MREFVGVASALDFLTNERLLSLQRKRNSALFKREALMFSRVAVYDLKELLPRLSQLGGDLYDVVSEELEMLAEEGMIFEPKAIPEDGRVNNAEFNLLFKIRKFFYEESQNAFKNFDPKKLIEKLKADPSLYGEVVKELVSTIPPLMYYGQYEARCASICMRELDGLDAYPVVSYQLPPLLSLPLLKCEVVNVTLNGLPIPDDSTPWEHILEYRSDPDSRSKFLALRHWMSEVARAELPPAEVEEKLEYLIDQYQKHMRLHRMKTNVGTLETIVTTTAEFLGDLVSFKWGKAAEALFSLRRRQVALLEGELTAPGNEVAYIVKARETFS